jgi:uncharacterized protein YyaL (SSP411 family)
MADSQTPTHSTNRLARETSPYLLQHAHNPVDWYPWGPEALERAKAEDKPIFLSVGYSACHWCHVMEHESFENPQIAALMNAHFVNIKVDREERPDIDNIYMAAVQAMNGQGGWPMSVFLTPDQQPFFGGTYYPPQDTRGMPGFARVLDSVSHAWKERRTEIVGAAGEMSTQLRQITSTGAATTDELTTKVLDDAYRKLARTFDPTHGGFGSAPKFPHPMDVKVLLRQFSRTGDTVPLSMARLTLDKMARGGIYDHLGGGFARYSTDERWLVPHFEKMLYDNALLTSAYLEAFEATQEPEYARVAQETLNYVLREMTDTNGGFYSTQDADSEGVEGKYYVWALGEIQQILGDSRAKAFAYVHDLTDAGNWEHVNILNMPKTLTQAAKMLGREQSELRQQITEDRAKLLEVRSRRVPPGKDTKILTSWNGLMIGPFAEASRILSEPRYLEAARRSASFLLTSLRAPDGRLFRSYKDGQAKFNAYLDDYANLIDGLTRLFETSGEAEWISAALGLTGVLIDEFADPAGGFYYTGKSHESLITRQRDAMDQATPAGNAMAATVLVRLAALTGRQDLHATASAALQSVATILREYPTAAGQTLIALDFLLGPTRQFAVVAGKDTHEFDEVLKSIYIRFLPQKVVAPVPTPPTEQLARNVPLVHDRPAKEGHTTTYVCEQFTCQAPVVGVEELERVL